MNYLMYGPWKEAGQMVPQTPLISERYYLPISEIQESILSCLIAIALRL